MQNALRHCTQTKPDSMLLRSWLVKSSLEEENLANATAAAKMNEKTKKGSRVLDINAKAYWNEEATATKVEAAEVPVEDECKARDSNISKSFVGNDLDYNNYCLECKCIPYYWHLLFDFDDTTYDDGPLWSCGLCRKS